MSEVRKFADFKKYMVDNCGTSEMEDGAVECVECGSFSYENDEFVNYDWRYCPVCGFDIKENI